MSGQKREPLNRTERRAKKHHKEIRMNQQRPPQQPPQQKVELNAEVVIKFRKDFREEFGPEQSFRMAALGADGVFFRVMMVEKSVMFPLESILSIEVYPSRIEKPALEVVAG